MAQSTTLTIVGDLGWNIWFLLKFKLNILFRGKLLLHLFSNILPRKRTAILNLKMDLGNLHTYPEIQTSPVQILNALQV